MAKRGTQQRATHCHAHVGGKVWRGCEAAASADMLVQAGTAAWDVLELGAAGSSRG